jgi:hypothetical protein
VVVATTQTGVGTVPEVTVVVTNPLSSDVPVAGSSETPPGTVAGRRLKATPIPGLALPLLSTTLNVTSEVCGNVDEPVPFLPMVAGIADINCILLT